MIRIDSQNAAKAGAPENDKQERQSKSECGEGQHQEMQNNLSHSRT